MTVDGLTLAGTAAVTLDTDTITCPTGVQPGRRHHHRPGLFGQPDAGGGAGHFTAAVEPG